MVKAVIVFVDVNKKTLIGDQRNVIGITEGFPFQMFHRCAPFQSFQSLADSRNFGNLHVLTIL
jgi:hypothetical protein